MQWEEMTVGFATKDFYAFLSKRPMLIGMPKYAVDAELGGYLKNQMKMINKRRRLEGRKRPKGSGPSA